MTEDRSWQYRSGHCLQLGKPNCRGCTVDDCACPEPICVAKRQRLTGIWASECENGGPTKSGPAGASTPVAPGLTPARRG